MAAATPGAAVRAPCPFPRALRRPGWRGGLGALCAALAAGALAQSAPAGSPAAGGAPGRAASDAAAAPAGTPALAAPGGAPTAQAFFALPSFRSMKLSPDGTRIAAVGPLKGRGNLVVVDLKTRQAQAITASSQWDVRDVTWIGNGRLYFSIADGEAASGRPRLKGGYAIDPDGTHLREVWGYSDAGFVRGMRVGEVLDTEGGESPVAYVAMALRSRNWQDVYRLDMRTLRAELLSFDSPGRVGDWLIDSRHRPLAAMRTTQRPAQGKPYQEELLVRSDGRWQVLLRADSMDGLEDLGLCGADADDSGVYVSARRGRDRAALWRYDLAAGRFGPALVEDPDADIRCSGDSTEGGHAAALVRDTASRAVVGFHYQGGLPRTVFFQEGTKAQAQWEALRQATRGDIAVRWSTDRRIALVSAQSDVNPGTFYLFRPGDQALEVLAQARPWTDPERMPRRRFIHYTARDGLRIPAYLTLPPGQPARGLPLIVNIHGGPMVRGYAWSQWGRWPEAAFFALHGYAVLEPEPRGSKGWGAQLHTRGFGQWGLAMQDDITDGALHLVDQGIVDRGRMCLHGGSYGGYAALQGLVREPGLFRCGNAFVAVTDLGLMQQTAWSDTAEDTEYDYLANEFTVFVGDSVRDAERFARTSPARNAAAIQGAVMLTMGSDDRRVPLIHGERMRDAMRAAGKPLAWKVYAEEGHGFNQEANVTDFYTRSLAFFDQHIGPGATGSAGPAPALAPAPAGPTSASPTSASPASAGPGLAPAASTTPAPKGTAPATR